MGLWPLDQTPPRPASVRAWPWPGLARSSTGPAVPVSSLLQTRASLTTPRDGPDRTFGPRDFPVRGLDVRSVHSDYAQQLCTDADYGTAYPSSSSALRRMITASSGQDQSPAPGTGCTALIALGAFAGTSEPVMCADPVSTGSSTPRATRSDVGVQPRTIRALMLGIGALADGMLNFPTRSGSETSVIRTRGHEAIVASAIETSDLATADARGSLSSTSVSWGSDVWVSLADPPDWSCRFLLRNVASGGRSSESFLEGRVGTIEGPAIRAGIPRMATSGVAIAMCPEPPGPPLLATFPA